MKAFRVRVLAALEDEASASLLEAGTLGIEVQASSDGRVSLLAYFDDETTAADVDGALRLQAECGPAEPVEVPEVDWVARFREGFSTFKAGSFQVVPVWAVPAGARPDDPSLLVVDPGRAFGTGTHETTRLCLDALESHAARRPLGRVVDVGTGTGLLAVAAAKRGASLAVGTDNDPEATHAALRHAALNGVSLAVVQSDGGRALRPGTFDLVLANLMAPLLRERRDELCALLAPGGAMVLSGLLDVDVAGIEASYATLGKPAVHVDGEWAALVFQGRA